MAEYKIVPHASEFWPWQRQNISPLLEGTPNFHLYPRTADSNPSGPLNLCSEAYNISEMCSESEGFFSWHVLFSILRAWTFAGQRRRTSSSFTNQDSFNESFGYGGRISLLGPHSLNEYTNLEKVVNVKLIGLIFQASTKFLNDLNARSQIETARKTNGTDTSSSSHPPFMQLN